MFKCFVVEKNIKDGRFILARFLLGNLTEAKMYILRHLDNK